MCPACPPMASTQPAMTSSTAAGSTSTRSSSPRQPRAPRSTGWTPASAPPRLPTAVRTASMTYASGISDSLVASYSAKHDGEVLLTHLLCGERSAGLPPAHRHPGGVSNETVDQVDVQVGPQVTAVNALIEHLDPHLALLLIH